MAGDLSVGERCLPAGAAAGAEKIPTSLTRSFQDVRCNDNQLSGKVCYHIINIECEWVRGQKVWSLWRWCQQGAEEGEIMFRGLSIIWQKLHWKDREDPETFHPPELFIIFLSNPFYPRNIYCLSIFMTINHYFHSDELPKCCRRQCLQSKERNSTNKSGEKGRGWSTWPGFAPRSGRGGHGGEIGWENM